MQNTQRGAERPSSQNFAQSTGWLVACLMLLTGLMIVFFPRPYWLAIGLGMAVPPLAYLGYVFGNRGARFGDAAVQTTMAMQFAGSSFLLALALAVRFWREVALVELTSFALVCLGLGAALTLLVQASRRKLGMPHFRFLLFVTYLAGTLGLLNKEFDRSAPVVVQGYVTEIDIRKESGKRQPRYYRVAPFLKQASGDFRVAPFKPSPVQVGEPVCSRWHQGAFGFPWFDSRIGLCPAPGQATPP